MWMCVLMCISYTIVKFLEVFLPILIFHSIFDTSVTILNSIICDSRVPNFLKCRIPVQTQLKPKILAQNLKVSWDQQLADHIAFGFPSDFDRSTVLTLTFENHASAKEHTQHIDQYIAEEVRKIAL